MLESQSPMISWDAYVLAYLKHQSLTQKSVHTHKAHEQDLKRLQQLIPQKSLAEINTQVIQSSLAKLHAQGLDPRTLARMLSSWRSYFAYLQQHAHIEQQPCQGIKAPKAKKLLPKALSVDQSAALFQNNSQDACTKQDKPSTDLEQLLHLRDLAIFELLYSSGLRLSEALGVNDADIDFSSQLLLVRGKGAKERIVPIGSKACEAMLTYATLRLRALDEKAFFCNKQGQRLGARQVQKRLAAFALEQGLDRHLHPHMLRHSCASHLLQSSQDLRGVQELLGHQQLSSTQVYTQLDFQHLAKVYDRAHPRALKTKEDT